MDTDLFKTEISFDLQPEYKDQSPRAKIRLGSETIWHGALPEVKTFHIARYLDPGQHSLDIELYDKPPTDGYQTLRIVNLSFGRIRSARAVWQGIYRPVYPEPWASQQRANGVQLQSALSNIDHLGWNGVWTLSFAVPIFTWIHGVENLGWIYD